MLTTKDLDTLWKEFTPHSVGLDDVFGRLDSMAKHSYNYPPYNLIKETEDKFRIEVALSGFKRDEIEVATEKNVLTVCSILGKEAKGENYLHKGISKRAFTRVWQLSEDVEVKEVTYVDGLLTINLERIVPEEQRRVVYKIDNSTQKELLLG